MNPQAPEKKARSKKSAMPPAQLTAELAKEDTPKKARSRKTAGASSTAEPAKEDPPKEKKPKRKANLKPIQPTATPSTSEPAKVDPPKKARSKKSAMPPAQHTTTQSAAEPAKEDSPKEKKPKEKKPKRKANLKPTLSGEAGMNISVARIKNIMDTFVLNKEESAAARELRNAQHPVQCDEEGKTVFENDGKTPAKLPAVPVSQLSSETRDLIEKAKYYYGRSNREAWEHQYVKNLPEDKQKAYKTLLRSAQNKYEETMRLVPECERGVFDVESFNLSYDDKFYSGFKEPESKKSEHDEALGYLSKLRVRFSAHSKIHLAAFTELFLRQLISNATYNCVKSGRKTISVPHATEFSARTSEFFPLYSVMLATNSYRALRDSHEIPENPNKEMPNFRCYVSEICRDMRNMFTAPEFKEDGFNKEECMTLNVGREFREFCNNIIFDIVSILGKLILTEINTRGVKTLNDTITKTVIEHLHSAHNIEFRPTLEFIVNVSAKYSVYVGQRKGSKDSKKTAAKDSEYDTEHVEE